MLYDTDGILFECILLIVLVRTLDYCVRSNDLYASAVLCSFSHVSRKQYAKYTSY
jgi:hypothetical protein